MGFIVAIDGPAGAGKGTITKLVGEKKNLIYIDTGALYRCVTLYALRQGVDCQDDEKVVYLLNLKLLDLSYQKLLINIHLVYSSLYKQTLYILLLYYQIRFYHFLYPLVFLD